MRARSFNKTPFLFVTLALLAGFALVAFLVAALAVRPRTSSSVGAERARRLSSLPPVILWAWERPEKLDYLDTRRVGVAFLARTLHLRGESVVVRPRLQPLQVAPDASLVAVVRIESDKSEPPTLSEVQRARTVEAIVALKEKRAVRAIQIDFDATVSERDFYRQLLFDVRRALPGDLALSMTALASWCMHDDWLRDLPVDEAVPMLFRMGADERQVRHQLRAGAGFRPPVCRASLGVSTDEPFAFELARPARLYVFHPRSWSSESVRQILERHPQ
jgi:hypothetical protein